MAGTRGPIGKRSDERIRRNLTAVPDKVSAIGAVTIPELGFEDPHEIVLSLYDSLRTSAQNKFYEPSDWQVARTALHFLDGLLKSPKPNAQLLTVVNQMMNGLLLSEGDRRRAQLEIERNQAEAVVLDVAEVFRERLAQQG